MCYGGYLRVALWHLLVIWVAAFNLEPRVSIVKEGFPGSYFGFSVAPHQILSSDRVESTLLVGAPMSDRGEGILWKCPFTSKSDDCVEVKVETGIRGQGAQRAQDGGQWLGTVVRSQGPGQQVIVCAPRYVKVESEHHRWGHGKCFTLTQQLKHAATWDPCEGREKNRAHEEWGYCQSGLSALLTSDNVALMGAPGPFTWRGTVFALSVEEDFLFRDKTHYHTPVHPGDAPVDKYAYLGMAVEAGNYLPKHLNCGQTLTYAAGAPRAGGTGKVVLFVKCLSERMKVQRIIKGEKFASSFGYALATVDLNGDGYEDLVVGAPFYHDCANGHGGAAYVYFNTPDGIDTEEYVKLVGKEESRFGFSMVNAGDINNDGYQDLVIGAPYDGRGKVFVYMGSGDGKKWKKNFQEPDQVISAEQIRGRFPSKTFGYSLGGGVDMDLNNHSDIAVGAFDSDVAVIIRSRPVIDIVTWFGDTPKRINPKVTGCQADLLAQEVCFTIESCFLIKNFPSNIETTYIRYSLTAEAFAGGRRVSRVRFGDEYSNSTHHSEKVIGIQRNSLTGCFLETAYLKRESTDITTPVAFLLSLTLDQDEPTTNFHLESRTIPNINQYPILNQQEARKELVLPFQKFCGQDDICSSNLLVELAIDGLDSETKRLEIQDKTDVLVSLAISNFGEPAYEAVFSLDVDPSFSYIGRADDKDDIMCEYSREGRITCQLGNPYPMNRTDDIHFRFLPNFHGGVSRQVVFNLSYSTTSEDINNKLTNKIIDVDIVKRAEVSIRSSVQPEQIWYGGQVRGESAMKVLSDIGSKVTHTFLVTNDGPWHMEEFEILIAWPFQRVVQGRSHQEPGKWLLYLAADAEISPSGIGMCYVNPRMVNTLGLREGRFGGEEVRGESVPRRKRSSDQTSDTKVISCADKETKCQMLTCRLKGLKAGENVVLRLRSRVWNSTLVEEFSDVDTVTMEVTARLLLSPESESYQDVSDDMTISRLVGISTLTSASTLESIPTWVILLSVCIGLVLVSLIVVILYKLGFFKRQRHAEQDVMISAKVTNAGQQKGDEYIS